MSGLVAASLQVPVLRKVQRRAARQWAAASLQAPVLHKVLSSCREQHYELGLVLDSFTECVMECDAGNWEGGTLREA